MIIHLLTKLEYEDKRRKNKLRKVKIALFYTNGCIEFNNGLGVVHLKPPGLSKSFAKALNQKRNSTRASAFHALVHTVFKPKKGVNYLIVTMTLACQYLSKLVVNQFLQRNFEWSTAEYLFKDSVIFHLLILAPQYNAGWDNKVMILRSEEKFMTPRSA
jgi:hypothetical protein